MNTTDFNIETRYKTLYNRQEEIVPPEAVKAKLDKALKAKKRKPAFFELRIPAYQSAAAAIIFFFIGFGISYLRPPQAKIIHTTAETVRYVDRPVKEIQYVNVPVRIKKNKTDTLAVTTGESNGISMKDDTIMQKMLVTAY